MGWQPETQPKGKPPVEKTEGAETMQRLIDAEPLEEFAQELIKNAKVEGARMLGSFLQNMVQLQPSEDAVPVTRCYECKHLNYEDGLVWMCERTHSPIDGIDGYCAWAKPEFTEAVRKQLDEWAQRKEADDDQAN